MADWIKIKNEYISTTISQRDLAEKHGVSKNTLIKKANKEKWADDRVQQYNNVTKKVQQKVQQKKVAQAVKDIATVDLLTQRLLEAIALTIDSIDTHAVIDKTRTKITKMVNGTPVEQMKEQSNITIVKDGIKPSDLAKIATALKDLHGIQQTTPLDDSVEISLTGWLDED